MRDPGLYNTVVWNGRPATIRVDGIEVLRLLIKDANWVDMESLHPWTRVKVTDGGYRLGINGLEGNVQKVLVTGLRFF